MERRSERPFVGGAKPKIRRMGKWSERVRRYGRSIGEEARSGALAGGGIAAAEKLLFRRKAIPAGHVARAAFLGAVGLGIPFGLIKGYRKGKARKR